MKEIDRDSQKDKDYIKRHNQKQIQTLGKLTQRETLTEYINGQTETKKKINGHRQKHRHKHRKR